MDVSFADANGTITLTVTKRYSHKPTVGILLSKMLSN
jgi:hypothetical protein